MVVNNQQTNQKMKEQLNAKDSNLKVCHLALMRDMVYSFAMMHFGVLAALVGIWLYKSSASGFMQFRTHIMGIESTPFHGGCGIGLLTLGVIVLTIGAVKFTRVRAQIRDLCGD